MALQGPLKGRTHRYRNAGTETMNSKDGFHKAEGGFLRAATDAAALIVTTTYATSWVGSAMAASDSGARRGVPASRPPVDAKYLVVPRPVKGPAE
jgi:hypothetical protein